MKRTFKKCILLVLMTFVTVNISVDITIAAQPPGLKIGDECPDLEFKNLINYEQISLRLSSLKGKLVIIDFWATWCKPCVKSLPKMDSLQKRFRDDLVIIPVSHESREKVEEFYKTNKSIKDLSLPSVTEDRELRKYFPHRTIPHEVWINQHGIIIAITDDLMVNSETIIQAIKSKSLTLPSKSDVLARDFDEPLIAGALGDNYKFDKGKILFQSLLTRNVEGVSSASTASFRLVGKSFKAVATNASIGTLYCRAFTNSRSPFTMSNNPDFFFNQKSRTIVDVTDKSKVIGIEQFLEEPTKWNKIPDSLKSYCYEIYIPYQDSMNANQLMVQDLNRYFGALYNIEGVREKRRVKCWVFYRTTKSNMIKAKNQNKVLNSDINSESFIIRNYPMKEFFFWLTRKYMELLPQPIVDETFLGDVLVDFEIHADMKNPLSVGTALNKYGIGVKLEEREIEMIIIRDKK